MELNNFKFKKHFGQNFLKDDSIPNKIVSYSNIKDNSLVIEIGPGSGMLTKPLSKQAKNVLAYEIDQSLDDILINSLKEYSNIEIIFSDFLKRDIKEDLIKYNYDHLYVIANLPYYITTPIITKLITDEVDVEKIVVMVQKEVGDRFSAKPNSRDYSSITVFLNYFFDIKKEFIVSKNCFIPKPNVDSVIISLTKKEKLLELKDKDLFFRLVKDSFQFKRKNIRNNLKKYNLEKIEEVLKRYNKDLSSRAEELELKIFVEMSNNLVD